MSRLKRHFEEICLRHMTDYRPFLPDVIPLKDIRNLVHDYVFCEASFEAETMALSMMMGNGVLFSAPTKRLARLILNSENVLIQNWRRLAIRSLFAFYGPDCQRNPFTLLLSAFAFVKEERPNVCQRLWCWFHSCKWDEESRCNCPLPLTRDNLLLLSRIFI